MAITICDLLSKWAEECPQKEAYVIRNPPSIGINRQPITFGQLEAGSQILAPQLKALGLQSRDRVVLVGNTCPELIYVIYAAMRASLVPLCLHPDRGTPEMLLKCANNHGARALLIHPGENEDYLNKVEKAFPGSIFATSTRPHDGDKSYPLIISMTHQTAGQLPNVRDMMKNGQAMESSDRDILESPKPEDIVYCLPTSGSTGDPKFVAHTHTSTINFLEIYSKMLTQRETSHIRHFSDRSFAWLGSCFHLPVVVGATYICTDPEYTTKMKLTKFVCDIMTEEEVKHTLIIPYLLYDLIYNPESDEGRCLGDLETVLVSGERVQRELLEKALAFMPKLQLMYGITEAGAVLTANINSDVTSAGSSDVTRPKYKLPGNVELRLSDTDAEGCGEIQIRMPCLFYCYLDNPEATRQAMTSDGWFSTGDVGHVLPDGGVYILGRCKDIISRASRKFYPIEFERVLSQHPKVEKCVVVGVPDPRLYEEICAVVIPREGEVLTESDLQKYSDSENFPCKPRHFLFMETFPLRNGKVYRKGIRDMAVKQLNLQYVQ